jgi:hypothetical protein
MIKRVLHFFLVVLFSLVPCLALAEQPTPMTTEPACAAMEFKAGEIIVKFREGVPRVGIQSLLLADDMRILDEMDDLGFMLLSVPKDQELEKTEELKRSPWVEYAEPNYVIQIVDPIPFELPYSLRAQDVIPPPNDPYFPSQWNLDKIQARAAWDVTTGSNRVVIAVVDSGVDLDHPEIENKIWTNPGETPGNKVDDDRNGYVDDVHGWDFVNLNGEPQDDYGHGTFVAGIAAAETNNGLLIAGVSWGAEIMPVKVVDDNGKSYHWDIAGGITYAARNGAKIITVSPALYSHIDPQPLQAAINDAYARGTLIVAGSGDPNLSDPIPPDAYQYPAALGHVVSVAATTHNDGHPDFSTYNDKVDVAAPGVEIRSFWEGGYGWISSTRVAAAHVSGLAALVWSVNPTLTPDEVESIIESTAVDLGEPGKDNYFGHGRIDASAAVSATTHYLEVEPDDGLYFLVCDDSSPASQMIVNPYTNSSTWSATTMASWLSISPPEGYTPSSVTVSINKDGLPEYGLYTTAITATSTMTSCVNNPKTITATVNYSSQCWRNYLPLLFKES